MSRYVPVKVYQLLIIILSAVFLGYFFGIYKIQLEWKQYKPIAHITPKKPPEPQTVDMALFYEVLDKINEEYYDTSKIDAEKIVQGAISGMLQSLSDPYTSFFPPKENKSFKTQLLGQFEGIGAELGMSEENKIIVISPLDNSPAQKAGVRSGDTIMKVDGKDTSGWTLSMAVEKIRGQKGTTVVLTLLRSGEKAPFELEIVRDVIQVKSVTAWVKNVKCEGKNCRVVSSCPTCSAIAYIRLSQFGDKTQKEWTQAIDAIYPELKAQKHFSGVVLDLRNNPGGYLDHAVLIASEFLREGVVVIQEKNIAEQAEMRVSRKGRLTTMPLIVLVNKGSASASEIVAAALQEHRRARIVGEVTFGKGTIQEAVDLEGGASIHISIAKWLTPEGVWVDKKGIKPDIEVVYESSPSAVLQNGGEKAFDAQLNRAILELVK